MCIFSRISRHSNSLRAISATRVSKEKELILAQQQLAVCPESKIKQYENDIIITQNAAQETDRCYAD